MDDPFEVVNTKYTERKLASVEKENWKILEYSRRTEITRVRVKSISSDFLLPAPSPYQRNYSSLLLHVGGDESFRIKSSEEEKEIFEV